MEIETEWDPRHSLDHLLFSSVWHRLLGGAFGGENTYYYIQVYKDFHTIMFSTIKLISPTRNHIYHKSINENSDKDRLFSISHFIHPDRVTTVNGG